MKSWGESFLDHYQIWFKDPVARRIFSQGSISPSIQILEYDGVYSGCRVFASLGLSHYANRIQHICEVYVPVEGLWKDVPALLANSLFYVIKENMKFGHGIGIDIGSIGDSFVKTTSKRAIYFTNPFGMPEKFGTVHHDIFTGKIYIGIFISEKEYRFFCDYGAQKFESYLEAADIDLFDLARPSCI